MKRAKGRRQDPASRGWLDWRRSTGSARRRTPRTRPRTRRNWRSAGASETTPRERSSFPRAWPWPGGRLPRIFRPAGRVPAGSDVSTWTRSRTDRAMIARLSGAARTSVAFPDECERLMLLRTGSSAPTASSHVRRAAAVFSPERSLVRPMRRRPLAAWGIRRAVRSVAGLYAFGLNTRSARFIVRVPMRSICWRQRASRPDCRKLSWSMRRSPTNVLWPCQE